MNPQEIKAKLERALRHEISLADWRNLERRGLVDEYLRNPLRYTEEENWREFRESARRELDFSRHHREDDLREQAGDLEEPPRETGVDHQPENMPVDLDDRTFARSSALGALNHLRSGGSAAPRATIHGTLLPRGGVDRTIPQWVCVIAAELWVPAEEVARSFRAMQRTLMADPNQPRTQARAFNVARFVWEVEAAHGERPSWPELCRLWNDFPMTTPFEDWRDFRTNFVRGEKATLPRYKATDEQITEQVREATIRGEAVAFDDWVSQVRAATVQRATVQRDSGKGRGSNGSNAAAIEGRPRQDTPGHPTL